MPVVTENRRISPCPVLSSLNLSREGQRRRRRKGREKGETACPACPGLQEAETGEREGEAGREGQGKNTLMPGRQEGEEKGGGGCEGGP